VSLLERRKDPRYGFQVDALVEWDSQTLRTLLTDISMGGMFLATNKPLWVGSACSVQLLLGEPLRVNCEVQRVIPGRGMGVRFVNLTEAAQARLEKLLEKLRE
jgi:c-di-GMP-binding flagellar brake protein YcgR